MKEIDTQTNCTPQCTYCGEEADTRDHVISKCFLDKPYPDNLITVPSCRACNESFSSDEEYVLYLLDFLISVHDFLGDPAIEKAHKTYLHQAERGMTSLEDRMNTSIKIDENDLPYFEPEAERIENVVRKLTIGLIKHELDQDAFEGSCIPRFAFRFWTEDDLWNLITQLCSEKEVQRSNFSYAIQKTEEGTEVRCLLSESLALVGFCPNLNSGEEA